MREGISRESPSVTRCVTPPPPAAGEEANGSVIAMDVVAVGAGLRDGVGGGVRGVVVGCLERGVERPCESLGVAHARAHVGVGVCEVQAVGLAEEFGEDRGLVRGDDVGVIRGRLPVVLAGGAEAFPRSIDVGHGEGEGVALGDLGERADGVWVGEDAGAG